MTYQSFLRYALVLLVATLVGFDHHSRLQKLEREAESLREERAAAEHAAEVRAEGIRMAGLRRVGPAR